MKSQKYPDSSQEKMEISAAREGKGARFDRVRDGLDEKNITEGKNSKLRSMNLGIRNAYDGMSMTQIAENGLGQVKDLLMQMRELAVRSSNGKHYSVNRDNLNSEFSELNNEISRIALSTRFNGGTVLMNQGSAVHLQLGSEAGNEDTYSVELVAVEPLNANVRSYEASLVSIREVDAMIEDVSGSRANFEAMQAKFEEAIATLQKSVENHSGSRTRISSAEHAVRTASKVQSMILMQVNSALSSQANVSRASASQLLG